MDEERLAAAQDFAETMASGIRSTIEQFSTGAFWDGYVLHELGVEPWDEIAQEQHDHAMERQLKRAERED